METNTELLNRIEAHIKGRLAVAESRAASSELYEGKKIAYNSLLGIVRSLRTDLAAQARPAPADVQAAAEKAALSYDMGTEGVAYQDGYIDGMLAERERLMKEDALFPEYDSIVNKVFGAGNLESWELDEAKRLVSLAKSELLKDLAASRCDELEGTKVSRFVHAYAITNTSEK